MPQQPIDLLGQMQSDIMTALDGYAGGMLDPVGFHNEMARLLGLYHSAAYFAGSGAETLDAAALRLLKRTLAEQLDYLTGFTTTMEDMSEAGIRARALLYAGSIKATYSQARFLGWDLPFHPTQGSECMSNCLCHWEIADHGDGTGSAVWHLGATERHCTTCPARASGSPYRVRRG